MRRRERSSERAEHFHFSFLLRWKSQRRSLQGQSLSLPFPLCLKYTDEKTSQGIKHLGPDFELNSPSSPPTVSFNDSPDTLSLKSGGLEIRVNKKASEFGMQFIRKEADGKEKVLST